MATAIDYALLSLRTYRHEFIELDGPIPSSWEKLEEREDNLIGFSAGAYRNTASGEIVIAYTGTNEEIDWVSNFIAGSGLAPAPQVFAAMNFYSEVVAQYGSNVTFTGHSLGAGLASMMAVFFDKQATVFDVAPFQLSAVNPIAVGDFYAGYAAYQLAHGRMVEDSFSTYTSSLSTLFSLREGNVIGISTQGEALASLRSTFPAIVGYEVPPYSVGENSVPGIDLHSMSLLTAVMLSPALRNVLTSIPRAVDVLMDHGLYADDIQTGSVKAGFLTYLIRNQVGVQGSDNPDGNGMLEKFAADLMKLAGSEGLAQENASIRDSLIVVAMEYYYFKEAADATSLFTIADGGLHFRYSDIGASSYKSLPKLVSAIKSSLNPTEQVLAGALLTQDAWHLQSGSDPLNWTANGTGSQNDAVIGGEGADTIDAGEADDIIIGGAGNDTLTGGLGNDILMGGAGDDTYQFAADFGSDIILDASGQLKFGNQFISGGYKAGEGYWITDPNASGEHFTFSLIPNGLGGNDLIVGRQGSNDTIRIRNWQTGELGITLSNDPVTLPPPNNTYDGDFVKQLQSDGVTYDFDSNGNYIAVAGQPIASRQDAIYGTVNDDVINGGGDNDVLSGFAGVDEINGGDGDDILMGGGGRDTLNGGDGRDYIFGSGSGSQDKPRRTDTAPPAATGVELSRGLGWVVYDNGSEIIITGANPGMLAGDEGNIIDGGEGDDSIRAGTGADLVHGGLDDDNILGHAGGDTLFGDEGADDISGDGVVTQGVVEYILLADHGNDVIDGGSGNDTLRGQGGDDALFGGADNDQIWGDEALTGDPAQDNTPASIHGSDYLDGGDGQDYLEGGGRDDLLFGGIGNDTLWGDGDPSLLTAEFHGQDILDGGSGADTLQGGGNDDALFGGADNDVMYGDATAADMSDTIRGSDYLDGEDGDDTVVGGALGDTLFGGAGNDLLVGDGNVDVVAAADQGDDYLDSGDGDDTLIGGGGADTLIGGNGMDELHGEASDTPEAIQGNDYLSGGAGDDLLNGSGGSDTLLGGADNDELYGDSADTPVEKQGNDYLDGAEGDDVLQGGGGADTLIGGMGGDTLVGDANDAPVAYQGNDTLNGGDGVDTLVGGGGADSLLGGADNDTIHGDDMLDRTPASVHGNDIVDGGAGDDTVVGWGGGDTISGGDGNDILFGDQDISLLALEYHGTDTIDGGDGDDYIYGQGGNDHLSGGEGGDYLSGGEGDDELAGGAGVDLMEGGAGNDTYVLSANDIQVVNGFRDAIQDTEGANKIVLTDLDEADVTLAAGPSFGSLLLRTGSDKEINLRNALSGGISSIDFSDAAGVAFHAFVGRSFSSVINLQSSVDGASLLGGNQHDQLIGLGNNAKISGGHGNDYLAGDSYASTTYLLEQGDGQDYISDSSGTSSEQKNTLQFGAGITSGSLRLELNDDQLSIDYGAGADSVELQTFDHFDTLSGPRTIDEFKFTDGSILTWAELLSRGIDVSNPGNFGLVYGTTVNDRISGSDSRSETIFGLAGDDVIDGGQWDDTLSGGEGSDTYLFARGDGADVISNNDSGSTTDALVFAADILPGDVTFVRMHDALLVRISGTTDSVQIADFFTATGIDEIRFANGSIYTAQNVPLLSPAQQATEGDDEIYGLSGNDTLNALGGNDLVFGDGGDDIISGSDGSDTVYGEAGNDVLEGGNGHDTLRGGDGDDTLRGGTGSDTLYGDAGSDTYVVELGTLQTVQSIDTAAGSIDVLKFGSGILPSDLRLSVMGTMLIIEVMNVVDNIVLSSVSLSDYFTPGNETSIIDEVRFTDAPQVVLDRQGVLDLLFAGTEGYDLINGTTVGDVIRGLGGDDQLNGLDGNDQIDGGLGNDQLNGQNGSDDLNGGGGNDQLNGGSGDDAYRFGVGSDRISETGGIDRIVLDAGIVPADVQLYRHSNTTAGDLILVRNGGTDQLRVTAHYASGGASAIESIVFNDGTLWDSTQIAARTVDLSGQSNAQTGTAGNDIFQVDHVADSVSEAVNGGTDAVMSSVSYSLPSNVEDLTLTGIFNIDGQGNSLNNTLTGNTYSNQLNGLQGVDTLIGGAGDDTYIVNDSGGSQFGSGWSDGSDDIVQESVGQGYDTMMVEAWSATLSANVERMVALDFTGFFNSGGAARSLTGNALDNVIDTSRLSYNSFGARLDGGAGADTLIGGNVDDTYVVDSDDIVIELGNIYSTDTVESAHSYILPDRVENLRLVGGAAINGTGNVRHNLLDGSQNSAANVLAGGRGDDRYIVAEGDSVVELAGEGIDTVTLEIPVARTYQAAEFAHVENFTLGSAAGASGLVGSDADNELLGNNNNNTLDGGAGDDVITDSQLWDSMDTDVLIGGGGNDLITSHGGQDTVDGGEGNDELTFGNPFTTAPYRSVMVKFGRGAGHDTLWRASNVIPYVELAADVATSDMQATREGRDLILGIAGDAATLRFVEFFVDETQDYIAAGAPSLQFASGHTLTAGALIALWRGGAPTNDSDYVFGTAGADILNALGGDDFVYAAAGDDFVEGGDGHDLIWGDQGADALNGGAQDDDLFGEAGNDILSGGADNDTLYGGAGEDVLEGGAGVDELRGGIGSDAYSFNAGWGNDWLVDTALMNGETQDTSIDEIVFAPGITPNDIQLSVNQGSNLQIRHITTGDLIIVGYFFNEDLSYGSSDPIERIRFADGTIWDQTEILSRSMQVVGTENDDYLPGVPNIGMNVYGLGGNDVLWGGSGNDRLDGGTGADEMHGGGGNDTFIVDNAGDTTNELSGEGTDEAIASVTHTIGANVERLTLSGSAAINGAGNSIDNLITGNSGNNALDGLGGHDTLNGGAGTDVLRGGQGNDIYIVDDTLDSVTESSGQGTDEVRASVNFTLATNVENLVLTGAAAISGTGNASVNVLTGNSADNTLNGLGGADQMVGGAGNDTYVVDVTSDTITEGAGAGVDWVQSSATFTLSSNVENLALTGTSAINGTGNTLDNLLTGNGGNNTLTGLAGNDTLDGGSAGTDSLVGGQGNDTYIVARTSGITITESSGEGTDVVQASVTHTLANNVENLTLTGASAINGTGNTLANVITGNAGNNTLSGGSGADSLIGSMGNDTYVVDNTADTITELAGEGTEQVNSSVTYTLAANVENLTLTGSSAINGIGNQLDNLLTGNTGNNQLSGGAGNDAYVVQNTGDAIVENANEGTDSVQSSVAFTLGNNVENLTLTGSSAINGTGNILSNVLAGNSGNNTLTGSGGNDTLDPGSAGTDTLVGGTGDDTYVVTRSTGITITENANEGVDQVQASVAYTLGNNIDLLFLTGAGNINGTGNTLNNLLRGNTGNNTLAGAAGVDILEGGSGTDILSDSGGNSLLNGGAGADTLTGTANNDLLIGGAGNDAITTGSGADIIVFNKGEGQDTVAASTTKDNTVSVGGAVYADLLFQKSGNNLILKVGSSDQITFTDYYASSSNRSVNKLQVVLEGTADYNSGSPNSMYNKKIETFDFGNLVSAFDAALAANPTLTTWSLTNALVAQHLGGSDTAAIGGDLAYRYGRFGNLSDISFNPALGILSNAGFGTAAQTLQALSNLQDTTARLN